MSILFTYLLPVLILFLNPLSAQTQGIKTTSEKKPKMISLSVSLDQIEDKGGRLRYCPNCGRKAATYFYYLFDKEEFKNSTQSLPTKNQITLTLEILKVDIEKESNTDSDLQVPVDGFTYISYTCKIVKVE